MTNTPLSVDTAATSRSAANLDDVAKRLDRVMNQAREALKVSAAGTDKVSVAAAHSFNTVATTFDEQLAKGTATMREVSAAITTHGSSVTKVDSENATTIVFV
ncbi:PE domain-containing protein [Gordonia crocea]|uniref:PE domain-containing protein n=1 Tax=Gordonia crocea TaxID=589162 RepID=A0A7I9UYY3_9ACTN|nr:PE domain-containing protein [Gordonia crocea]GED98010.1 hypothetical protein nbrc107697_20490 [Gordonia crocea]